MKIGEVEVHRKCRGRRHQAFSPEILSGCRLEGLWKELPEDLQRRPIAKRRSRRPGRWVPTGASRSEIEQRMSLQAAHKQLTSELV